MIATIECASAQDEVLRLFLEGKRLTPELRDHYFQCVDCIVAVTARLESRMLARRETNGHIDRNGAEHAADVTAAQAVLARGYAMLKREFGIDGERIAKDRSPSATTS